MDILPSRVTNTNQSVALIGNVPENTFIGSIRDRAQVGTITISETGLPNSNPADGAIAASAVNAAAVRGLDQLTALKTKVAKQVAAVQNAKAKTVTRPRSRPTTPTNIPFAAQSSTTLARNQFGIFSTITSGR